MLREEKERYTQCKERKAPWQVESDGAKWRALIAMLVIIPRKTEIGLTHPFETALGNEGSAPKVSKQRGKPHHDSQNDDSESEENEQDGVQNEDDGESAREEVDSELESSEEEKRPKKRSQRRNLVKGHKESSGRRKAK